MAVIGNRYLQGSPILPYAQIQSYEEADLFLDLAFVDHTGTEVTPISVTLEIDDITNSVTMLGPVNLLPAGNPLANPLLYPAFATFPAATPMVMQVAGSIMVMTFPYVGSQSCQFKFAFTALDSVTGQPFEGVSLAVVDLCSAATVSGSF